MCHTTLKANARYTNQFCYYFTRGTQAIIMIEYNGFYYINGEIIYFLESYNGLMIIMAIIDNYFKLVLMFVLLNNIPVAPGTTIFGYSCI